MKRKKGLESVVPIMNVKCRVSTALGPALRLEFAIALEFRWDFRARQGNTSSLLFSIKRRAKDSVLILIKKVLSWAVLAIILRTVLQSSIRCCTLGLNIFLKSVNSNFTLAVRSPKFWQAKTHFLSHHNVC